MNLKTSLDSIVLAACLAASLTACGGSSSSSPTPVPPTPEPPIPEPPILEPPILEPPIPVPAEGIPRNTISHAYFRDQDSDTGKLAGTVQIQASTELSESNKADSLWIYWADVSGNKIDNEILTVWLKTDSSFIYNITIPTGTLIPDSMPTDAQAFMIYPHNEKGLALTGTLIKFHDFIGNSELSGPGGNEYFPWYYGQPPVSDVEPAEFTVLRDKISVHRSDSGRCIFDNGLVGVIDMDYAVDETWVAGKGSGPNAQANEANDSLFPIYEYPCAEAPINTHRWVGDRATETDDGIEYVWTY